MKIGYVCVSKHEQNVALQSQKNWAILREHGSHR